MGAPSPLPETLIITAAALLIEACAGYPQSLFRAIGHPVTWLGALLSRLDRAQTRTRTMGALALLDLLAASVGPAFLLQYLLSMWLPRIAALALLAILASTLLAQRSLFVHVRAVAVALERNGVQAGREAVSHIVGRNPNVLDEHGVARAAIESLAENFSDGVVAPALWCGVFGLPGIAAYKAVNTADSMIGHRTPRHETFGWASARLDDFVNLPASRLAAIWITLAALLLPGASAAGAWRTIWKDARKHRSPNAGWPEAALAGALGLRLNGPRIYGTTRRDDAWTGDGRADATAADIFRALRLYALACVIEFWAVAALAVIAQG